MPTPSCGCITAYTKEEKLWAIYCALYQGITEPVNLPSCECVKSYTELAKLDAIYCAILQLTAAVTGPIEPSQIEGITPFGIAALTAMPGNDMIIGTDGAGAFDALTSQEVADRVGPLVEVTSDQISNSTLFGRAVLTSNPGNSVIPATDGTGVFTLLPYTGFGSQLVNMFTPDPDQVLGTDSGGLPTSYAIGQVGSQLLAFNSSGVDSIVTVDAGGVADLSMGSIAAQMIAGTATFTGTQSPVNSIDISNGIVTTVS